MMGFEIFRFNLCDIQLSQNIFIVEYSQVQIDIECPMRIVDVVFVFVVIIRKAGAFGHFDESTNGMNGYRFCSCERK